MGRPRCPAGASHRQWYQHDDSAEVRRTLPGPANLHNALSSGYIYIYVYIYVKIG